MTRRRRGTIPLLVLCASLALLFTALGVWQIERLQWKRDLIERVERRLAAPPVPLPPRSQWGRLDPREWEYRRVRAAGWFDHSRATLVDALTERGAGNWLIVPLMTADGPVLVNRGFVPKGWQVPRSPTDELGSTITGLFRLSEPNGRALRANDPAADRWYSRDVAAIAASRGLKGAAPFFIDADASANGGGYPVGGLTIVRFRNAHLLYALTWFGLAILSLVGLTLTWKARYRGG